MRPPVVADLDPGAGAPLLAAALHGIDAGAWAGGPVDVLVALASAGAGRSPDRVPVLVLVADGPAPAPGPPGGPVVLPVVPQWRGPDGVRAAAGLLRLTPRETPVALRPAAAALRAVVAALLRSGALERPCRAPSPVPAGGARVVGPAPAVVRRPPTVPVLLHRAAPVAPRLVTGSPLRWARSVPAGSSAAGPGPVGSGRAGPEATEPGRTQPGRTGPGPGPGPGELGPDEPSTEPDPAAREPVQLRRAGVEPGEGRPAAPVRPAGPPGAGAPEPPPAAPRPHRAAARPAPAGVPAAERRARSSTRPVRRRTLRAGLVPAGTGGSAVDRCPAVSGPAVSGPAVSGPAVSGPAASGSAASGSAVRAG